MTNSLTSIDILSPGGNLDAYIQAVHQIPLLSVQQEQDLAHKLADEGDLDAARQLVMTHLRFVIYVARSYSGYGLPQADLIQEGNVGLMKAVRRFDPTYGVRVMSFAVHWIKAEIHEFILRNWRIVKVATTKPQRKLFFNLRRAKQRLGQMNETELADVADTLGVPPEEVRRMETRLSAKDASFDADTSEGSDYSPSQYLASAEGNPADLVEANNLKAQQKAQLATALTTLDPRAQEIIQCRWLAEKKVTLHELASRFDISAERVRQLEQMALKKLKLHATGA